MCIRDRVEAVHYMNEPSQLVIQCDSPYAVNVTNSGTADGKKYEKMWRCLLYTSHKSGVAAAARKSTASWQTTKRKRPAIKPATFKKMVYKNLT